MERKRYQYSGTILTLRVLCNIKTFLERKKKKLARVTENVKKCGSLLVRYSANKEAMLIE